MQTMMIVVLSHSSCHTHLLRNAHNEVLLIRFMSLKRHDLLAPDQAHGLSFNGASRGAIIKLYW